MKKIFTLIATLLLSICLFAQAPQKMNYQAVVRNASNSLVANQNVSVRITLLQGSATGAAVYSETHNVQTNANGLMTLEIGGGNAANGSFAAIDWANGPYFIKSEIDPEGGINYSVTTTQQLLSVPYALYAATSGNGEGPQGPVGPQGPQGEPGPAGQDGTVGPQGPQGPQGEQGVSPVISIQAITNGNRVIITSANSIDTFVVMNGTAGAQGNQGPAGPQGTPGAVGPQGPQGPQGEQGVSPVISIQAISNGNRVIITSANSIDTFVVMNGVAGAQGNPGPVGPQGNQGPQGEPGPVGPQGIQGPQGEPGPAGPQGEQGPQGPAGQDGFNPVVTITTLDTMRTQVNITSAAHPEGQNFIVRNGSAGGGFVQEQADWLENDATSNAFIVNKPVIPAAANNATLTIQKNGTEVGSFTANASVDKNININIPTATSELTNNSGFITSAEVPTQVGQLNNDANYVNNTNCPSVTFCDLYNALMNIQNQMNDMQNEFNHRLDSMQDVINALSRPGTDTTGGTTPDTPAVTTPTITTSSVSNITTTTATCGGNVTDDGGATVTARGVCWSTSENPTIENAHTTEGTGTGSFTSSITGLTAGTTYYVRAYATNSEGTAYGEQVSFTTTTPDTPTLTTPTITTSSVSDITTTTATCGGNVTDDGGATVTARGVCWSTSENPTVENAHTTDSVGSGNFVSTITGLTAGTTYYVRAYATNSEGTAYGEQMQFETVTSDSSATSQSCPGTPTITDVDGNVYNTIALGEQCWMKENLRTTKYANSTPIALGNSASETMAYRYNPNNNQDLVSTHGYLYNWKAVMGNSSSSGSNPSGVQGICPTGWHVPSYDEWTQLMTFIRSQSDYYCNGNPSNVAKALSSTTGWSNCSTDCSVGNNQEANNATGFSAVPVGYYYKGGYCYGFGESAYFWHSTELEYNGSYRPLSMALLYNETLPKFYYDYSSNGYSVRCLRDVSLALTVTTSSVSDITGTTAICGGNVTNDGGSEVTARGVCWSTSRYPTIEDAHTTDGTGTGSFTSSITGLTVNTAYYVRAYATNQTGTVYGDEVSLFTVDSMERNPNDAQPCSGTPTVTDHEGNVYNTVQIGTQCWTKENMRCETSPSTGTYLPVWFSTQVSYSGKMAYYPNNGGDNYGLLYNWCAAVDTFNTAYGETSINTDENSAPSAIFSGNRRGICPQGWHVPSDAEWTQLESYINSQSDYVCDGNNAKALASTSDWNNSNESCSAGNDQSANNVTGFSAVPTGYIYSDGNYYELGYMAAFWSSTQENEYYVLHRGLTNNRPSIIHYEDRKCYGYSVRCLRDSGIVITTPSVTTASVSEITDSTATCGGNVTENGGANVTARGVCWSTSENPTVEDAHTTDSVGTGSFVSSITGLTAGTRYYVRAYATNKMGTAYGEQVSIQTTTSGVWAWDGLGRNPNDSRPCSNKATITDHEGNIYNTVQIGNQCWMKENMRCTTSPSTGTSILETNSDNYSYSGKKAYYVNEDAENTAVYGLLYNYCAVMDVFNPEYGETNNNTEWETTPDVGVMGERRGICPQGWHVPSASEWDALTSYVGSQSEYVCGNDSSNIAKALASTVGWGSSTGHCGVGNDPSSNNATGFSAVPAGCYSISSYGSYFGINFNSATCYWAGPLAKYMFISSYDSRISGEFYLDLCWGFSVRCVCDETILSTPTVTTSSIFGITNNTATCGGNVTSDGGIEVTARGVCWSTSPNPTINDAHTTDGSGIGSFTSAITGLTANTTYYVRAYATNNMGTTYGERLRFYATDQEVQWNGTGANPYDSKPCPDMANVSDHEGNIYNTVQIGNQCWMKENMRCTTSPSTGTTILEYPAISYSYSGKKAYYVNGNVDNTAGYGLLYNWCAAMDIFNPEYGETSTNTSEYSGPNVVTTGMRRGICPQGWHVPNVAEWDALTTYVRNQNEYLCGNSIAKALNSTTGWRSSDENCTVGNNPSSNNATGFSAVPAGWYIDDYSGQGRGIYYAYEKCSLFWTATSEYTNSATYISLDYVSSDFEHKSSGLSVRCLRDETLLSTPTVTTASVSGITNTTAICGGEVTNDGGTVVTARGVCWSTSPNPTINDAHTTDGSGMGTFSSSIAGLTANTTYFVRAYATNGLGTAYGERLRFYTSEQEVQWDGTGINPNDSKPCDNMPTVTDHEGNVYNTVQIGSQCWTKENMRCTTSPSTGTSILSSSDNSYSFSGKKACYYNDNPNNAENGYGLLYNWCAAVDTFNIMLGEVSTFYDISDAPNVIFTNPRRGICPQGWHVPNELDWIQLTNYVGNQSEYVCGIDNASIAKALASTTGWKSYTEECSIGNEPSGNNATGFSVVPASLYSDNYSKYTGFWSASQGSISYSAYLREFEYDDNTVYRYSEAKSASLSVRCLRD